MEGLKAKLAKMKEQLEAAEERAEEARKKRKEVEDNISRFEDEARGLRRRKELLQQTMDKVESTTDEKLDRLERLAENIHETEVSRRKLERKELKEDGTLNDLDSRAKYCKTFAQEAEQRYREALNKLMLAERETTKVNARIRAAKSKEEYFTSKLNDVGRTVGRLTRSEESKQASCAEYQDRIRRLTENKEKSILVAETMERKAMQLEQQIIPLRQETTQMVRRENQMKKELRDLMDEVNTYPSQYSI